MGAGLMRKRLGDSLRVAARRLGDVPGGGDNVGDVDGIITGAVLEAPRHNGHGDLSCPLALALAKIYRRKPMDIAQAIVDALDAPTFVADVRVAPPGFINFYFSDDAKINVIAEILTAGENYGRGSAKDAAILLEYVSANPTGPLHIGHGRACAYGDTLANILECNGYTVRREYYINNAGRQTFILAASVWLRHWQRKQNTDAPMPPGSYRGDYLVAIADALGGDDGLQNSRPPADDLSQQLRTAGNDDAAADALIAAAVAAVPDLKVLSLRICDEMMTGVIKKDIQALNVNTDNIHFYAESQLHEQNALSAVTDILHDSGNLYEKDGAQWFRATAFGDDKDRVIRRSNGEYTYFTADIAYHADKCARFAGAHDRLINVLGADHHGYVPRLRASIQALGNPPDKLETQLIQFVALMEDGKRIKMSTRAGEFITLRDLVGSIGAEAARYFFLSRKNDQHLDFDLSLAKSQKNSNPFFYIQYAYARINSIFDRWQGGRAQPDAVGLTVLRDDAAAVALCGRLRAYPDLLTDIACQRAPHLLTVYLHELANALHTYYESVRILPAADTAADDTVVRARLALLQAVATVLDNGMRLLGVKLSRKMKPKGDDTQKK